MTDDSGRSSERNATLDDRIQRARQYLVDDVSPVGPGIGRVQTRARRERAFAGLALAFVIVAVAALVQIPDDRRSATVATGETAVSQPSIDNRSLLTPGEVRPMAPSPLAGRSSMASVWTGAELLIWGGETSDSVIADGAAYDPVADAWRTLASSPLSARNAPAAVWTGAEMFLWGGHAPAADHRDGAMYDPATDTWVPIADAPIDSAGFPQAVWTGTEVLVLAGYNSTAAAAYDPNSDTWRTIAPVPGQPLGLQAVWTGEHLVTRAAYPMADPGTNQGIFAYDPVDDRWTELPAITNPGSPATNIAWTGEQLIQVTQAGGAVISAYDPDTEERTALNTWPTDAPTMETSAWTGSHLLLWGGGTEALLVDPVTGTFTPTPAGGGPNRIYPAAAWADGVLLVWGGWEDLDDGFLLRPVDPAPSTPGTTVTVLPDTGDPSEPDLIRVAGPAGSIGYVDRNGGPAHVNGDLLPVLPVVDGDGTLIGYFGCSFLEREVVESENFDPASACSTASTVKENG